MRALPTRLVPCFLVAWTSLLTGSAGAHGGIPRVIGAHLDPSDPAFVVAQSDAWGLFVSRPQEDFGWVCAEAYGGDSLGVVHATLTVAPGGSLFLAHQHDGLLVSSSGACDWTTDPHFDEEVVTDIQQPAGGLLYVLTSTAKQGGLSNRVWVSEDAGASWRARAMPLPADVAATAAAVTSSGTIHVAARSIGDDRPVMFSLEYGDENWRAAPVELQGVTGAVAFRLAVDPADSQRIFLRVDRLPESQNAPDPPDALMFSPDGGASWTTVQTASADLPGLTFSPDDGRVFIAGPSEGLWVAQMDRLAGQGTAAMDQVSTLPIWGVTWTRSGLFAGHDDFAEVAPRFALGVSQDAGRSFAPVMSFCDVRLLDCPSGSRVARVCPDVYSRLGGFEQAILQSSRCSPATPRDAGPAPSEPEPNGGSCACRTGQPPASGLHWSAAAVLLLQLSRMRRSRRNGGLSRARRRESRLTHVRGQGSVQR